MATQPVTLPVPKGPIAESSQNYFVNRELLPLLAQLRTYVNGGVFQERQSTITTVTQPDPTTFEVRPGSQLLCTLDRNITLALPSDLSTDLDTGVNYSIVFLQDATGGRTVTFSAGFTTSNGWALSAVANAYTVLDVRVLENGTHLGR